MIKDLFNFRFNINSNVINITFSLIENENAFYKKSMDYFQTENKIDYEIKANLDNIDNSDLKSNYNSQKQNKISFTSEISYYI